MIHAFLLNLANPNKSDLIIKYFSSTPLSRIGLQCARLFVPAEIATKLDYPLPSTSKKVVRQYDETRVEQMIKGLDSISNISSSCHDRTTRSYRVDSEGILITAGTPWWRCDTN